MTDPRVATLRVRMTPRELEAAELRAVELGFENFSQFVRAALRGSVTSSSLPASVPPPRDIDPAECPKRSAHRKGVFCKHCGATP